MVWVLCSRASEVAGYQHVPQGSQPGVSRLTKPAKTKYICVGVCINKGGGGYVRYSGEGPYVI